MKSIAKIKKDLKTFQRDALDEISQHAKLRKGVTHDLAKKVLDVWNRKCAICPRKIKFKSYRRDGKLVKARTSPVMAHVVPVEEGGKWELANLLPLCERKHKSLDQALEKEKKMVIESVGCHKLYDEEGVWTRTQMRELLGTHDLEQAKVHRPREPKQIIQPDEIDKLLKDAEEKINRPSKAGCRDPLDKIKQKLEEYEAQCSDWSRRKKLALGGLRLARRPYPTKNQQQWLDDVRWFYRKVEAIADQARAPNDKLIINYERGMVPFEFGDFENARRLIRKDLAHLKKHDAGWVINEAQACVCDFELARKKKKSTHSIKSTVSELKKLVPRLERLAESQKAPPIHKTWPVTAWLHIARMKAYLGDSAALLTGA